MKLTNISEIVNKELSSVDTEIRQSIPQKQNIFTDACLQILSKKSKRIRPILVLLSSGIVNLKGKRVIRLATAVELFHTATLVHDDIIDDSSLRRGAKTINTQFGVHSAILVADYLYLYGTTILNGVFNGNPRLNKEISKLILKTANNIFTGELSQLLKNSSAISKKEYFNIISQKTASFFSACCTIPALLAGANNRYKLALILFGRNLGIAFQIIDDILDIVGDEKTLGKKRGSDLKEGFFTLPLVHLYENATKNEKNTIAKQGKRKTRNLNAIVKLINKYGSLEYAMKVAKSYSAKAKRNLDLFPQSKYKNALSDLCDFVVERDN